MKTLTILLLATAVLAEEGILLTGGWNAVGGARSECSLMGWGCPVPPLPMEISDHITGVTDDGTFITCGGEASDGEDNFECVALDLESQTWVHHSTLDRPRILSSSLTIPGVGLFIIGGFKENSTLLLPTGTTEWVDGPVIPGNGNYGSCSVAISDTKFLVIGGSENYNQVTEYDTNTGQWTQWPELHQPRWGHACTKLGDQIIIAGGSINFGILSSTSILDITTKEQRKAGNLAIEKAWFGMQVLDGKVFAFGGQSARKEVYNTIEQWDESFEEWVLIEDGLDVPNKAFGHVLATVSDFCV